MASARNLAFGLKTVSGDRPAYWGARAIIERDHRKLTNRISLVWDRQSLVFDSDADKAKLVSTINAGALERFLRWAGDEFSSDESRTATVEFGGIVFAADPRRSYGYLYITAWVKDA